MKKESILRYTFLMTCSVILAAFPGLGATGLSNRTPESHDRATTISPASALPVNTISTGLKAKNYYAILVDNNGNKWFLTEMGIVSFSGGEWTLHNKNAEIGADSLRDFAFRNEPGGPEFWVASPLGATVATLPFDAGSKATTYNTGNAGILSNDVVRVSFGKGPLRWFGTDKGICAYSDHKWLTLSYDDTYPYAMFSEYPITSIATNPSGDSLYVGTDGAGVARVFRNDVDGISGASVYAQWGPIIIPSDKIYSIYIASDGTKWFGTDQGVATHKGNNTLDNWTVYTTDDGLVNNFVQAITADKKGNLWFGTKGGGLSVFDGTKWTSYTANEGLNSNNILCLAVDNEGVVWIGTDDGVNCFNGNGIVSYR